MDVRLIVTSHKHVFGAVNLINPLNIWGMAFSTLESACQTVL